MGDAKNTNIGLQIGGGLYSAYQTYKQGEEEHAYADQLAASQEANAYNTQITASKQLVTLQQEANSFMSSQRAAVGASGLGGQSNDEVISGTAYKSMLDQLALKENTANQVNNLYTEAAQTRLAGRKSRQAANTQTITSLLGTAKQVSDTWYQWKKEGKT